MITPILTAIAEEHARREPPDELVPEGRTPRKRSVGEDEGGSNPGSRRPDRHADASGPKLR